MKFEIGNPSDQCFLEADDAKVAAACILFLGNGQYFYYADRRKPSAGEDLNVWRCMRKL